MSFLPAVDRKIASLRAGDRDRVVLEYLRHNAVGAAHPVSLDHLIAYMHQRGFAMSGQDFQQGILAESRDDDFFIGSGPRGYFLIAAQEDAQVMKDFYDARIAAESQNRDNLLRQANAVRWNLA